MHRIRILMMCDFSFVTIRTNRNTTAQPLLGNETAMTAYCLERIPEEDKNELFIY